MDNIVFSLFNLFQGTDRRVLLLLPIGQDPLYDSCQRISQLTAAYFHTGACTTLLAAQDVNILVLPPVPFLKVNSPGLRFAEQL